MDSGSNLVTSISEFGCKEKDVIVDEGFFLGDEVVEIINQFVTMIVL